MPEIGDFKKRKNYVKRIWHACVDCGKERWVDYLKGKPIAMRCRVCAMRITQGNYDRNGSNNGGWKGGRTEMSGGYIGINLTPDDFFFPMVGKQKHGHHVYEHRLVMAKHLKRCLLPWEVVHHKNGIRDDNRIENLELLPHQSRHTPSIRWQTEINKRDKKIAELEARIVELERRENAS